MKLIRNGDQGMLARLAATAPGQNAVQGGDEDTDYLPTAPMPQGDFKEQRSEAIRDNDSVQASIASAGKRLGYQCVVSVSERMPETNSHYVLFFSKQVKGQGTNEPGLLRIKFDVPSFGLVQGEFDSGPDWIEPQKKLALIRDVMKVAANGSDLAALPMNQEINVNSMVSRQLGLAQNAAGGTNARND